MKVSILNVVLILFKFFEYFYINTIFRTMHFSFIIYLHLTLLNFSLIYNFILCVKSYLETCDSVLFHLIFNSLNNELFLLPKKLFGHYSFILEIIVKNKLSNKFKKRHFCIKLMFTKKLKLWKFII